MNSALKNFLGKNNLTVSDLASRLGVSYAAAYRYVSGARIPSAEMMTRLYEATGGAVTPNDFYNLPPEAGIFVKHDKVLRESGQKVNKNRGKRA